MAWRERLRSAALRVAATLIRRTRPADGPPRRVLLLRPDHMGDLLLTTPALACLRAALPDAHLSLMVGPWNAEVARHVRDVDEVLTLPFPFFDRRPKRGWLAPYRVLGEHVPAVAGGNFDTAVVWRHDFWWGALLTACAGIPRRVGFAHHDAAPFLTDVLPEPWPVHEAERCVALARRFGGSQPASPPMSLAITREEAALAGRWLAAHGIRARFAVVHPGSGAAVKLWPAAAWSAVADALAGRGVSVVLTGTAPEADLLDELANACRRASPATLLDAGVGVLGAVIQRAVVAAGPDSGVLHLAQAVGTPTVRLFGPVDPERFGPWGHADRHRVVRAGLACQPCNRLDVPVAELPWHPCVQAIRVDQVVTAMQPLLAP